MGAELFHAYRQTDMTELIVDFRNFANAPNKVFETFHFSTNLKYEQWEYFT